MKTFVDTRCPMCGMYTIILVNEEDLQKWQCGELAQNAFPYLSAEERETLISGICPACWNKMFGSDDDYTDDLEDYLESAEDDYIEDDDEGDYEEEIYDLDMGFDPYMGEYTFDC